MYCKNIPSGKTGLLLFVLIIITASSLSAQSFGSVSPPGERGASFIQTVTVNHVSTPFYIAGTTTVNFPTEPRMTWSSISDSMAGWDTYHTGRIVIPRDVPAGYYQISITNAAWGPLTGTMYVGEFVVNVTVASPSELYTDTTGQTVILNINPALKNYSSYTVLEFNCSEPGVTLVSGSFISPNQMQLVVDVSATASPGPLDLYIKYGVQYVLEKEPAIGIANRKGRGLMYPQIAGDYNTIFASSASAVISVVEARPVITNIIPASIPRSSTNLLINIEGRNFKPGASLYINHPGLQIINSMRVSPTLYNVWVSVSDNAQIGPVTVVITNPNKQFDSNSDLLRITGPRPQFSSMEPTALFIGRNFQNICIIGADFSTETGVTFASSAISVLQTTFQNPGYICLVVSVADWASSGPVGMTITNEGGVYTTVPNAVYLTNTTIEDKTIQLLSPGAPAKAVEFRDETELEPTEIINTGYPVFRWFSRALRYKISLYKPLPGQTSYLEVLNNRPVHQAEVNGVDYWQYPLYARELKTGIRYFWKVDAYFNTVPDDLRPTYTTAGSGFEGEIKESQIWSFVVHHPRGINRPKLLFGTLNPIESLNINPPYVEVVAGDRVGLEIRGLDRFGNLAAFVPDPRRLDYRTVERNYPDARILPKSFGTAEIIVPNITSNSEFQRRLMRNPAEFSRFPILIKTSRSAKGVAALLVTWKNKKYYALIASVPPEKEVLKKGQINRFRIGNSKRTSEAFEVVLNKPIKINEVFTGTGMLLIDSAGFREIGYIPVKVKKIRLDSTGRAYTGEISFEGKEHLFLADFEVQINSLIVRPNTPMAAKGKLKIPASNGKEWLEFQGELSAIGNLRATAEIEKTIKLSKTEIPKQTIMTIDFDTGWSPPLKKYDPAFRGIIIPIGEKGEVVRKAVINNPDKIDELNIKDKKDSTMSVKKLKTLDGQLLRSLAGNNVAKIFVSAEINKTSAIGISWKVTAKGNRSYNVYRRTGSEQKYRLIAERLKARKFVDVFTNNNESYWYKVVGLDERFNEITFSNPLQITNPSD